LIGNGWLHEAPKNIWPREWDIRSRSALRKCMFLPVPPHLRDQIQRDAPPHNPAPMPIPRQLQNEQPIIAHRQDPKKHALMFQAISPQDIQAKKRALYADEKAKLLGRADAAAPSQQRWFEDPVALGTLLIMFPPIGLAALWSSKRYSNDARWALTVMTALTMCLGAAIVVAIVALKS